MANHNFIFTDISNALPDLMNAVLCGDEVGSRNGRTKELISTSVTLTEPWRREILTPGRKASLPAQIAETMWVLAGRDDIAFLGNYLPRAKDFSDDGVRWQGAYGPRLRAWQRRDRGDVIDQLAFVVDLLKKDPLTRRAVMVIYDPDLDGGGGKDIPCNDIIQFTSRLGRLDAHVFIRSNDLMWGFSGINATEWSSLQEIIAGLLGIQVGSLHLHAGSLHLYEQHWAKAQRISDSAYLIASVSESPRFSYKGTLDNFDSLVRHWFTIERSIRTGWIHHHLSYLVNTFPEPMLRSWLQVIGWWWSGDEGFLENLKGTALYEAAKLSPIRVQPEQDMLNMMVGAPSAWDSGTVPKVHSSLPDPGVSTATRQTLALQVAAVHEISPEMLGLKEDGFCEDCPDHGACSAGFSCEQVKAVHADPFTEFVANLHAEKHAVYGNSWKKRGEQIGILANIARKVDRLGVAGGGDTAADTVIDLLVYLLKYRLWMTDNLGAPPPVMLRSIGLLSDMAEPVTEMLQALPHDTPEGKYLPALLKGLRTYFDTLEHLVRANPGRLATAARVAQVEGMTTQAAAVARRLWTDEQPISDGARIDNWKAGNATRSWNPENEAPAVVSSEDPWD